LEDDAMTATCNQIENLVLRIQTDFLENPLLSLTLAGAQKRFGIDEAICAGVLGALVDARVLAQREGTYRRYFPRLTPRRAA
jgi:hypothetical protein